VMQLLAHAKQAVPALMAEVTAEARQAVRTAKADSRVLLTTLTDRAITDVRRSRENTGRAFLDFTIQARQAVTEAATRSEALIREIAGQGPEKTLARGFAIVRDADGATITSAGAVSPGASIEIQFRDGKLAAKTADKKWRDQT
jgi:exodeoxyribonuclease VII large subunit